MLKTIQKQLDIKKTQNAKLKKEIEVLKTQNNFMESQLRYMKTKSEKADFRVKAYVNEMESLQKQVMSLKSERDKLLIKEVVFARKGIDDFHETGAQSGFGHQSKLVDYQVGIYFEEYINNEEAMG